MGECLLRKHPLSIRLRVAFPLTGRGECSRRDGIVFPLLYGVGDTVFYEIENFLKTFLKLFENFGMTVAPDEPCSPWA